MAREQRTCWDPRYEFNAPRFYDFKATHEDSEDDIWFDTAETAGLMSPDSAQPPAGLSQPPLSPHSADSRKENAGVRAPNNLSNIVTKWEPRSKSKISGGMSKRTGDAVKCANTSGPSRVSALSGGTSAAAVVSKPLDGCKPSKRKRSNNDGLEEVEVEVKPRCPKGGIATTVGTSTVKPTVNGDSIQRGPSDPNLQTAKKLRRTYGSKVADAGWKPLALQVAEFQTTLACHSHVSTRRQPAPFVPRLTEPTTVSFATDGRLRGSKFKPREEAEADEMALRSPFRARPVRRAVLEGSGTRGLPVVEPKPPTVAESPRLATQERAAQHPPGQSCAERAPSPFHALPLNRAILEGPTLLRPRPGVASTAAHSPFLRTKTRGAARGMGVQDSGVHFTLGAPDKENMGKVTRSHAKAEREQLRITEAEPFNLATDARGAVKQSALQRALAEKAAGEQELRARARSPPPRRKAAPAPPPPPKLTVPAPFDLESVARHQKSSRPDKAMKKAITCSVKRGDASDSLRAAVDLETRLKRERELARKESTFKAQPIHLPKRPFAPAPSEKLPTKPQSVKLAVVTRSAARAKFDEEFAKKQAALEAERAAEEAARLEREEQELREYRKTLQFKARPVPRRGR